MKKIILFLTALVFLASCSPAVNFDLPETMAVMKTAGEKLIDIQWNVDYNTFSSQETTEFAKKYYDSEFLENYLLDTELRSGVYSVTEEKLIAKVTDKKITGVKEALLGDPGEEIFYKILKMQTTIYIDNFEPLYPEDTFFEQGREYVLNYDMYFKDEGGKLVLSGFEFIPANEPFLPKSANNVPLTFEQQASLAKLAREYYDIRYSFDYKNYSPKNIFAFYTTNMTPALLAQEKITLNYLNGFYDDIVKYQMSAKIISLNLGELPINKERVNTEDSTEFYYTIHAKLVYSLTATEEYFEMSDTAHDLPVSLSEKLCFTFIDGVPKIAYAEYEEN